MINPDMFLRQMFQAAIDAAQPALCLPSFLPAPPKGRLVVLGAGKASAAMARAVEDNWKGDVSGLVVTRYGYNVSCRRIEIVEAAHPVPDNAGEKAARRMLDMAQGLTADDTVLCLMSGGGSALLPLPLAGITLAQKQDINRALLVSGAPIAEMNTVRRHLSGIKGGRLAAACFPAQVVTLVISDVPGDDPADIASGPTVADKTTCADALAILDKYRIPVPENIRHLLQDNSAESIKPGDARLQGTQTHLIATPKMALEKAAALAREGGVTPYILGDSIEGDARIVGQDMAALALDVAAGRRADYARPCVLLSGGETTVTVTGSGTGGRNVEFLLAAGIALGGNKNIYALAGDTDGVDGMADIAGGIWLPETLEKARALGIDAAESLRNNDGHGFFGALGQSVITGPTRTNVNDFRAFLIV